MSALMIPVELPAVYTALGWRLNIARTVGVGTGTVQRILEEAP